MRQTLSRRPVLAALSAGLAFPALARDGKNPLAEAWRPFSVPHDRANAWLTLPPTPPLPVGGRQGRIPVGGADLFYARYGRGLPVILLHGGLGNANYWGYQIPALAERCDVIALDLRGHGRSTMSDAPMSYALLAADVLAAMDALRIETAAFVGWSDGAIVGLTLAMHHPDRVERLFSFGANADPSGLIPNGARTAVFAAYTARAAAEYRSLSPTPERYGELVRRMAAMWAAEPRFSAVDLGAIPVPADIADGDHDEIIKPQHTRYLAGAIPNATLTFERGSSHFAMLQNPASFNADVLRFLGRR